MDAFSPLSAGLGRLVPGRLVRGHQVASGLNRDPKFPGGSLAMQVPHFRDRGLDLREFHLATLNVSIAPLRFAVVRPAHTFRGVIWHPTEPAEDFSFFDAAIRKENGGWVPALIYHPHPETKPAHFQPPDLIEVLAKAWIADLAYEDPVELALHPGQIEISG